MPDEQSPVEHWLDVLQASANSFFTTQEPALQNRVESTQSASALQLLLQTRSLVHINPLAQVWLADLQAPAPSHFDRTITPVEHEFVPQSATGKAQVVAEAPSQLPAQAPEPEHTGRPPRGG
jgi:hypothetical protein